jgi:chromosome segregation ATPase
MAARTSVFLLELEDPPSPPRESPVPEPDEIIRRCIAQHCVETWSAEQQDYASELEQSLAALESYEARLEEWHSELVSKSEQLDQQNRDLEERRKQFAQQQASDLAMTAELDQARAEVEDLRQRLAEMVDPIVAASAAATGDTGYTNRSGKSNAGVELLDPSVSAVAKQFQKLRQQQAARRSAGR